MKKISMEHIIFRCEDESLQGDSLFEGGLLSGSVVDVEQIVLHQLDMGMVLDI